MYWRMRGHVEEPQPANSQYLANSLTSNSHVTETSHQLTCQLVKDKGEAFPTEKSVNRKCVLQLTLNNVGIRSTCALVQLKIWFCIYSLNQPWIMFYCGTYLLKKKNLHLSGPTEFEPMLVKGQLYFWFHINQMDHLAPLIISWDPIPMELLIKWGLTVKCFAL